MYRVEDDHRCRSGNVDLQMCSHAELRNFMRTRLQMCGRVGLQRHIRVDVQTEKVLTCTGSDLKSWIRMRKCRVADVNLSRLVDIHVHVCRFVDMQNCSRPYFQT